MSIKSMKIKLGEVGKSWSRGLFISSAGFTLSSISISIYYMEAACCYNDKINKIRRNNMGNTIPLLKQSKTSGSTSDL